jgi:hypothetical protein
MFSCSKQSKSFWKRYNVPGRSGVSQAVAGPSRLQLSSVRELRYQVIEHIYIAVLLHRRPAPVGDLQHFEITLNYEGKNAPKIPGGHASDAIKFP